jgi:hypothetical protein
LALALSSLHIDMESSAVDNRCLVSQSTMAISLVLIDFDQEQKMTKLVICPMRIQSCERTLPI